MIRIIYKDGLYIELWHWLLWSIVTSSMGSFPQTKCVLIYELANSRKPEICVNHIPIDMIFCKGLDYTAVSQTICRCSKECIHDLSTNTHSSEYQNFPWLSQRWERSDTTKSLSYYDMYARISFLTGGLTCLLLMRSFTCHRASHCTVRPKICLTALTLSQWSSSGNPVCLELRPQCTLECHWRKNCW